VLGGIPGEDWFAFPASSARRKELLIRPSRRMKHTYPAAIALAASGQVELDRLASHQFSLVQTQDAFETAAVYADGAVRAMVLPNKPAR
jgi:L-iditol 2-dehydrogenase